MTWLMFFSSGNEWTPEAVEEFERLTHCNEYDLVQ